MGFWLLVPGVGMGGSEPDVPEPVAVRRLYRPLAATLPSSPRPQRTAPPTAYRPTNPVTPSE